MTTLINKKIKKILKLAEKLEYFVHVASMWPVNSQRKVNSLQWSLNLHCLLPEMGFSNQDTSSIHRLLPSWLNVPAHTVTCLSHTHTHTQNTRCEQQSAEFVLLNELTVRFRESMDWNNQFHVCLFICIEIM